MARFAMVLDSKTCVGCTGCVAACKTENNVPDGFCRSWIVETVDGQFPDLSMEIRSERCNHCSNAPCVRCCPTGASYKDDTGTVLINRDACTGCKACIASCPYDARFVHPVGYVEKCTFCIHRVREGKDPACVSACPAHAMHFGDLDDKKSNVSKLLSLRKHKRNIPEAGTDPNIYYLI